MAQDQEISLFNTPISPTQTRPNGEINSYFISNLGLGISEHLSIFRLIFIVLYIPAPHPVLKQLFIEV
jgi:hypothetical protein